MLETSYILFKTEKCPQYSSYDATSSTDIQVYVVYHKWNIIVLLQNKNIYFSFMCEYIGIRLTGYGKITDYIFTEVFCSVDWLNP